MIDLARIGACPTCRGSLEPTPRAVLCGTCGARWPVISGIPRFVSSQQYVGSFGWEWRRHHRTQIDSTVQRESERVFAEKTGLTPADVRGKLVLDVGVGSGRFSDVVARWGGHVVGVDLSLAVLSAHRNLARYGENALVAQCDLFKLPFKEETFDVVFSIGVLHHTPSTRDAFRSIARFVKPGGHLAAAVYKSDLDAEDFSRYSDRYRRYTTHMSHSLLHLLSHGAVWNYELLLGVRRLFGPRIAARAQMVLNTSCHKNPLWRILDTFDWYSPRYQWRHDAREVRRWFEDLGLEAVRNLPEETMVSVCGKRSHSPLLSPPPSEERRVGTIEPLPAWIPETPALRDPVLVGMLAGSVLRTILETLGDELGMHAKLSVTRAVVTTKDALGIDGDLIRGRR